MRKIVTPRHSQPNTDGHGCHFAAVIKSYTPNTRLSAVNIFLYLTQQEGLIIAFIWTTHDLDVYAGSKAYV